VVTMVIFVTKFISFAVVTVFIFGIPRLSVFVWLTVSHIFKICTHLRVSVTAVVCSAPCLSCTADCQGIF
jgi:hypothetical protein